MLEQFEGAREAFALVRQEIVAHAVANGFVDLPADRMEISARGYVTMAVEVVMPRIDEACREARAAGISGEQIRRQVAVTMNDFTSMLQDALRECGLNIQVVSGEIQGPRHG